VTPCRAHHDVPPPAPSGASLERDIDAPWSNSSFIVVMRYGVVRAYPRTPVFCRIGRSAARPEADPALLPCRPTSRPPPTRPNHPPSPPRRPTDRAESGQAKRTAYFYDEYLGNYTYGGGNPMRPHRVRLTHSLVKAYGVDDALQVRRPRRRSFEQLTRFHADEYVDFLRCVTPENQDECLAQLRRYNLGLPGEADCPVFDGMYDYCRTYCGASVDAAALLASGDADLALNWSGGMHHAKKAEASGFCYLNDIVLAILELLKTHQRVLYVDIDIHHGDGVEEAFYLTDRVMTVRRGPSLPRFPFSSPLPLVPPPPPHPSPSHPPPILPYPTPTPIPTPPQSP